MNKNAYAKYELRITLNEIICFINKNVIFSYGVLLTVVTWIFAINNFYADLY